MNLMTAAQMRELDRATIEQIGIPGIVLMENAGRGTVAAMQRRYADLAQRHVVVLCGRGNNGGDGFVIARYLRDAQIALEVYLAGAADRVAGDARTNLDAFRRMGGRVVELRADADWAAARDALGRATLIVDALLGTGLSSDVTGALGQLIAAVNRAPAPVVAVDIPSGLDATSGRILGTAVRADLTCTYGSAKIGQAVYPGVAVTGALEIIDIGIPAAVRDHVSPAARLLNRDTVPRPRPRPADAHKGTAGHVAVCAGSAGKTGAALLAAHAAMRMGAGLVTLAVPAPERAAVAQGVREVMTAGLGAQAWFDRAAAAEAGALLAGKTAVAIGPGIGTHDDTAAFLAALLPQLAQPVVIDADALNLIAADRQLLAQCAVPAVLTPHPGEMARLAGTTTEAVQADRIGVARSFAGTHRVIVVLKGARTVVALPDGAVWINASGNAGMASGGMGDALTGMIAGLLAQAMPAAEAALLGVWLHGAAGDRLADEGIGRGMLASDIIERVPTLLCNLAVDDAQR